MHFKSNFPSVMVVSPVMGKQLTRRAGTPPLAAPAFAGSVAPEGELEKPFPVVRKPAQNRKRASLLRRLAWIATLGGGSLLGVGGFQMLTKPAEKPLAPFSQPDLLQSDMVNVSQAYSDMPTVSRSLRAEYTGNLKVGLETCSSDGLDVRGQFYVLWEKDLFTLEQKDKDVQLQMLLDKMPSERKNPKWAEDAPSVNGPAIVEAYQQFLFDTEIVPVLRNRFHAVFGERTAHDMKTSPTTSLIAFESEMSAQGAWSSHYSLRETLNDLGLTPRLMGFSEIQVGQEVIRLQKYRTEGYDFLSNGKTGAPRFEALPPPPSETEDAGGLVPYPLDPGETMPVPYPDPATNDGPTPMEPPPAPNNGTSPAPNIGTPPAPEKADPAPNNNEGTPRPRIQFDAPIEPGVRRA